MSMSRKTVSAATVTCVVVRPIWSMTRRALEHDRRPDRDQRAVRGRPRGEERFFTLDDRPVEGALLQSLKKGIPPSVSVGRASIVICCLSTFSPSEHL